ncbi:hypothetical protein N7468_002573 [Penicillium chermesinum]|uniref:L-gulonate 3-dehydrogenase n=1 Tax=Penicillium chermesinum TaxID=63820 RepID=A0A9W9PIX6_9EURO|nr:uncharacterized protein N7468_002573 [Penicillium chermesinum]KAJ5247590.1 hypothetical protein N7468_002573 [Penicillium chermesinum]
MSSPSPPHHIALLGGGTIGLSMLALHLRRPDTKVTLYDPRPDIETQLRESLPTFLTLPDTTPDTLQALWTSVAHSAPPTAHLWSSSSGIPASQQAATAGPAVAARLLVVHPFNPPHLMPLIEIVPGPDTALPRVDFVTEYFGAVPGPAGVRGASDAASKHYRPVVLGKEMPGFVGNRLAFALLREAVYLVQEGVVSVRDLDKLMMASLGPRWAGSGVFESYHAGGGEGGIAAILEKLAPTIGEVWRDLGQIDFSAGKGEGKESENEGWRDVVVRQTEEAYGPSVSVEERTKKGEMLRGVIDLQKQNL